MARFPLAALLALVMSVSFAGEPDSKQQKETIYEIRDLVANPASLPLAALGGTAGKDNPALRTVEPAQRAALIVQAVLASIDQAGEKPGGEESIHVLNGTRLVMRTSAARHALFAEALKSIRRLSDLTVFAKAQLYETDHPFYTRLKSVKRIPLDELERQQLEDPRKGDALFGLLKTQKLLLAGEEVKMGNGMKAALLSRHQAVRCQPSPDQVRKGKGSPQTVWEGASFHASIQVSADRRFVQVKLTEKAAELQDILKVKVRNAKDKEVNAEIPSLLETSHAQVLDIPDGGTILVPVHYRPRSAREKERWWVLSITPRIRIEAENP